MAMPASRLPTGTYEPHLAVMGNEKHEMLTRADEVELSKRIHAGHDAATHLAEAEASPGAVAPELLAGWNAAVHSGEAAFEDLVLHNRRLVVYAARRYVRQGHPLEDLVQEGLVGLLGAASSYDGSRGFRFSTFAMWWIRRAIGRATSEGGPGGMHIPSNVASDRDVMERAVCRLESLGSTRPTVAQIVEESGLTRMAVDRARSHRYVVQSLNATVDGGWPIEDTLPDTATPPPVASDIDHADLERYLASLPPTDAQILRLRFGLDGGPCTLGEIAAQLGVSRQRIGQRERRAMAAIKLLKG